MWTSNEFLNTSTLSVSLCGSLCRIQRGNHEIFLSENELPNIYFEAVFFFIFGVYFSGIQNGEMLKPMSQVLYFRGLTSNVVVFLFLDYVSNEYFVIQGLM